VTASRCPPAGPISPRAPRWKHRSPLLDVLRRGALVQGHVDVREDRPGRDHVHVDTVRRQFDGELLADMSMAALVAPIRPHAGFGHAPVDRRNADDLAFPAPLDHVAADESRAVEAAIQVLSAPRDPTRPEGRRVSNDASRRRRCSPGCRSGRTARGPLRPSARPRRTRPRSPETQRRRRRLPGSCARHRRRPPTALDNSLRPSRLRGKREAIPRPIPARPPCHQRHLLRQPEIR